MYYFVSHYHKFTQLQILTNLLFSFLVFNLSNMGRKFVVGGNWKMNGDKKQVAEIVETLKKGSLDPNVEVMYKAISILFQ